jgi:hypothetical protein
MGGRGRRQELVETVFEGLVARVVRERRRLARLRSPGSPDRAGKARIGAAGEIDAVAKHGDSRAGRADVEPPDGKGEARPMKTIAVTQRPARPRLDPAAPVARAAAAAAPMPSLEPLPGVRVLSRRP